MKKVKTDIGLMFRVGHTDDCHSLLFQCVLANAESIFTTNSVQL